MPNASADGIGGIKRVLEVANDYRFGWCINAGACRYWIGNGMDWAYRAKNQSMVIGALVLH
jgi:hypothetical protein